MKATSSFIIGTTFAYKAERKKSCYLQLKRNVILGCD